MESYTFLFVIVSLIALIYWYMRKKYSYFDGKDFPTLKPTSVFGNVHDVVLLKKAAALNFHDLYNQTEPHKYVGLFILWRPFVLLRDPELIKNVLIKDFAHFHDRGVVYHPDIDPLHHNILRMEGDKWKKLRVKLTPMFTSGKMKMMFPLVLESGRKLVTFLDGICKKGEAFDTKDLCARYTIDVIGSCAFGIETNTLEDPNSKFREIGERMFKFRYQVMIRYLFTNLPESLARFLKLKFVDEEVERFLTRTVENIVKYREENNITRYDFLDLLIAMKNESGKYHDSVDEAVVKEFLSKVEHKSGSTDIDMTMDLLVAQCYLFFGAGSETSSTALGFLLLELALSKPIQMKIREEIFKILGNNDKEITFEDLREMTYLDMVIAESLRKHPPAGVTSRHCKKSYPIPNSGAVIPQKMPVYISIYGLHMDPKYYEKPHEFYPEHFTEEAKRKRPPCTYLPFGDGPRVCIAERFAKMQMKICLVSLLKDFSFDVSPKMKFPIEYDSHLLLGLLTAKNGLWLQCQKI